MNMPSRNILLELSPATAAKLGAPYEEGDEVYATVDYSVFQDSFDHEFGTHYYDPQIEFDAVIANGTDLLSLLTDAELDAIIERNKLFEIDAY